MDNCRQIIYDQQNIKPFVSLLPVIFLVSVKTGQPSKKELEDIASKLNGDSWKILARRFDIEEPKITALDKAHDDLFEKAYQMLLHWTQKEGEAATYQFLFEALDNDKVNRRDLAQKYCCGKKD